MADKRKKNPTIQEEAGLSPDWQIVDALPIRPDMPEGSPSKPNGMPPFFSGTISPQQSHDFTFSQTKYGTPAIPILPLMPVSPAGVPTSVASIVSVINTVTPPTPTPISGTGNMNFRGQWSSTVNYAVNDVVLDNISTYIAVTANLNQEPDSGSSTNVNWNLLGKNLNFRGEWLASSSPATVAHVQSALQGGGAGPTSATFSNPNAAGNTIIVYVLASHIFASGHADPGYTLTVTDTQGNTYTPVQALSVSNNANAWEDTEIFVAANCKAGPNTVTFTPSGGSPTPPTATSITIAEYTGNPAVYPVVANSGALIFANNITSITVSVSTGQPSQVVLLFSGTTISSGAEIPPAGFATRQLQFYDKTIAVASTNPYTLTYSGVASGGLLHGIALTNVGSAAYVPFDTVIYQGSTYVCIKTTTGAQVPTNTTYWYLLSQGTGGVNALGANYNIIAGDDGQLISNSTASNYTATLLSPPPYLGWWAAFQNSGSGTLVVSPNGLTLDGSASSFTLNQNQGMLVFTDGANYFTERGIGTITSLPSIFNVSSQGVATLTNEVANSVFAGPTSGPAAPPTFRAIVAADLPAAVASFNRKVISSTTYSTISSDVGKALDVQTSSATTITLRATPAAPTFVRSYGFNRLTGNQTTGTISATLTTGNLSVITVECYRVVTDTITVADSNGNTWNKVPNTFIVNNHNPGDPDFGSASQQIWYSNITNGGVGVTITATFPITVNYPAIYGCEAANVDTVDQAASAQANGSPNSGNITTTTANEFLYGTFYNDTGGSTAAGSGWTLLQQTFGSYLNEYRIPVATGTFAADTNNAGPVQYVAGIASFAASPITPFSGFIQNNGTAVVAVIPSSGLINGQSSLNLFPGQGATFATDGVNFTSIVWEPGVVAAVDLTAQGAAITATNIYSTPTGKAGMYRISWSAKVTRAATTSSVLAGTNGFQITYTDAGDSVVVTPLAKPNAAANGNTTGVQLSGVEITNAKAGTNIQYQIDYTSVGGTTMQYNLHIKVEYLGS